MHICHEEVAALMAGVPILSGVAFRLRYWFHSKWTCYHLFDPARKYAKKLGWDLKVEVKDRLYSASINKPHAIVMMASDCEDPKLLLQTINSQLDELARYV